DEAEEKGAWPWLINRLINTKINNSNGGKILLSPHSIENIDITNDGVGSKVLIYSYQGIPDSSAVRNLNGGEVELTVGGTWNIENGANSTMEFIFNLEGANDIGSSVVSINGTNSGNLTTSLIHSVYNEKDSRLINNQSGTLNIHGIVHGAGSLPAKATIDNYGVTNFTGNSYLIQQYQGPSLNGAPRGILNNFEGGIVNFKADSSYK
ncbi:hypothetical protein H6A60_12120, partial [Sutterella massiliensis]